MSSDSNAQVWLVPLATEAVVLVPLTETGVDESVVVPSPSWPSKLCPQHLTVPSDKSVQVWPLPAAIEVEVVIPLIKTGVEESVFVPSPSWQLKMNKG